MTTRAYAILLAAAALTCAGCGQPAKLEARDDQQPSTPVVAVSRAVTEDLAQTLVLTAEFKPYQEVEVMAKVAGFIKKINVDVGDRVRQGQLLATLEIPEMTDDIVRDTAAVERAEAEVARASDDLTRAQSAHEMSHLQYKRLAAVAQRKPGLVAQQEIDDAQGRDLVSEAQVASARSNLTAAKQQVMVNRADLKRVQTMFEYTRVTAPFTGVVTRRFADTGAMIQAGTASQTQAMPVVRISENSLLRLILPVPESAVPTVHIGQRVDVRVPALGRTFQGKVARFADKVVYATRTMDTEVDVPNPGLVLIPGMWAEVDLTLAHRHDVVTIPVTAVEADRAGSTKSGQVMLVSPTNRLEVRKVGLGLETSTRVEVAAGLNEGDMVVVGSRSGLQAGQEVRPKVTEVGR